MQTSSTDMTKLMELLFADAKKARKLYRILAQYPPYRRIGGRKASHTCGWALRRQTYEMLLRQFMPNFNWEEAAARVLAEHVALRARNGLSRVREASIEAILQMFSGIAEDNGKQPGKVRKK